MPWERPDREQGRQRMRALVARFTPLAGEVSRAGAMYSEAELRNDFLDEFILCLGWDVGNRQGLPQRTREVRVEPPLLHAVEDEGPGAGRPDYELRASSEPRLFLEAKKPSVRICETAGPSQQTRRYGYSGSLPVSALSNFCDLLIYDTRDAAPPDGHALYGVIARFRFEEYVPRFDELWDLLSHEVVTSDRFFAQYGVGRQYRGESNFDAHFLAQIRSWRRALASEIATRNPGIGDVALGHVAQRLLNALVFLRVCEDRGVSAYGELLAESERDMPAFVRRADRRYNAGLFDELAQLNLDPAALRVVVRELYHPASPYSFAVVDTDVLAAIYEQFLSERVVRIDGRVELEEKPEAAASGGVVPTPLPIVRELVGRALGSRLAAAQSADALIELRVCDPACGSGPFLVEALRRLLDRLEAILGRSPTLAERRAAISACIYGVDIDPDAVQVCRFSLLLSLLEEGQVDAGEDPILPSLSANIQVGNSVIDSHFEVLFQGEARRPEVLLRVKPFDWHRRFPTVFAGEQHGFAAVVSNPPYVRIQNLSAFAPEQLGFFTHEDCGFSATSALNFDLYQIFIERTLRTLLAADGTLAMVVPHRFASSSAGRSTRHILGRDGGSHVREIVHFGTLQVFAGRTTYVCLLVASSHPNEVVVVDVVSDIDAWLAGRRGPGEVRPMTEFGDAPWTFASPSLRALHVRLQATHPARLGAVSKIFVGIQTSADRIYFVQPQAGAAHGSVRFTDAHGQQWDIEEGVTRPAMLDAPISAYDRDPLPDRRVIFPYRLVDDARGVVRAVQYSSTEMQAQFPRAMAYLRAWRAELEGRSIQAKGPDAWFAYGRSQSLTQLDAEKVVVRVLSLEPQYGLDRHGLAVAGGGDGGPYYLLRRLPDALFSHGYLVGILSHPAIDSYLATGKRYRGGYIVHRKAFLEELPIPDPRGRALEVESLVADLQHVTVALRNEQSAAEREVLAQRKERLRERLNDVVSDLLGLTEAERALFDA